MRAGCVAADPDVWVPACVPNCACVGVCGCARAYCVRACVCALWMQAIFPTFYYCN